MNAQISEGGTPYSTSLIGLKSTTPVPVIGLEKLDVEKLRNEDIQDNLPCRFGIYKDTLIDFKARAKVDLISNKGRIWRLEIRNESALSLQVVFNRFIVPEGAQLFLYNEDMTRIEGAFTKRNMRDDSRFVIADFRGGHVILEYFEPDNPEYEGQLVIGSLGQGYEDPFQSENASTEFVNINCPVGKDAQLIKHAVCRMVFRSGPSQSYCSGALINNVKQDETPYFLTANHCISTNTEASSLITYFNYEIKDCTGDTAGYKTLTGGSTLLTTGKSSDFTLLKLKDKPPVSYQPFYAGWNVYDSADIYVTSIHVPFQQTKKISIDYDSIFSLPVEITWDDESVSPVGSHWVVSFDLGKSIGGSSGGPLFNNRNQIIGQLHGGDEDFKFYGKLSSSYKFKSKTYPSLRSFIDPDSTSVMELSGYSPAGNPPDAFFTTEADLVCVNTPVKIKDYSAFGPYNRKWMITPATFSFLEGTTDTSANPVVAFHENAYYTVDLNLSVGGMLKSTKSKTIKAGNEIAVSITSKAPEEICDCDFDSIMLVGNGGELYNWELTSGAEEILDLSSNSGDTVYVYKKAGFKANGNYYAHIAATGTKGTCSANDQFQMLILKPLNDDISNAVQLDYGSSSVYTNICGTTEEGEPVPPITSCVSQLSWCDECMNGTGILQNSVWFTFVPDITGKISISSKGYDNQIALYDAESPEALFNNEYELLAANDDRSDSDPHPLIISQLVTAGKTYWIQVDGSFCGAVDDFYMVITDLTTGVQKTKSENLKIYPQPAFDYVMIKGEELAGSEVEISVYSVSGQQVCSKSAAVVNGAIRLDVSFLEPGMYLVNVNTGNRLFISRMVKY
ncbi:MAG: T9SS type A sorting domain-containing protein [Bacteroidales bacterium]|nr:T9SS type A sorting domain-containing protein [Bacteroidales bacterium]